MFCGPWILEILGNVAGRWILCEAGDMVILSKILRPADFGDLLECTRAAELCWMLGTWIFRINILRPADFRHFGK